MNREPGFYWVKDQFGNWVPALWEYDSWWSIPLSTNNHRLMEDEAIGPRILPPDELEGK